MFCIPYCQSQVECCWRCCELNLYRWPFCVTFHSSYTWPGYLPWQSFEIRWTYLLCCSQGFCALYIDFEVLSFTGPRCIETSFCTYVRPLLEFSSQIWSPHHRYLIDKIESVRRFFTKKLSGLQNLTYLQCLKVLGLESLERRRLIFDLVLCYKIIHAHCNTTLEFTRGCTVTHGNMYKMSKQNCTTDTTKYFLATVLLMCGIVFLILLWLLRHSMTFLKMCPQYWFE